MKRPVLDRRRKQRQVRQHRRRVPPRRAGQRQAVQHREEHVRPPRGLSVPPQGFLRHEHAIHAAGRKGARRAPRRRKRELLPSPALCRAPLDSHGVAPIMFRVVRDTRTTPRWRNWQTHYFEVVAPQGVQVQILSWAFEEGDPDGVAFLFSTDLANDAAHRLTQSGVCGGPASRFQPARRARACPVPVGRSGRSSGDRSGSGPCSTSRSPGRPSR
jgi:hypothetical protein